MNQVTAGPTPIQALFVAWQDQKTKRYFPVGRLLRLANGASPRYEFCYLRGTEGARKAGFTSFPAFQELEEVYRSNELFPLFENRLMSRSRPDFSEYVGRLDLDPEKADEFDILARSGGRRATDSLELFPCPDLDRDGCYITYFLAHGIRYLSDEALMRINSLAEEDRLRLQWDLDNEADQSALSLRTEDRIIVGYLPRYLLDDAWELLFKCDYRPLIQVERVNPVSTPIQQRLLCKMEACWPDGFRPYQSEGYRTISTDAVQLDSAANG